MYCKLVYCNIKSSVKNNKLIYLIINYQPVEMSFSAHLFSDASQSYFSKNSPSSFTNKIPKLTISATNEYEVAITDILYSNCFYPLPRDSDRCITVIENKKSLSVLLPNLVYYSGIDILNTFNLELSKITKGVNITSSKLGKVILRIANSSVMFNSPVIPHILGFNNKIHFSSGDHLAELPPKRNLSPSKIFIFCDLIHSQIIADRLEPVIGCVSNSETAGVVSLSLSPYYLPVIQKEIESISISLRNEKGELLQLLEGRTQISLHFRKL